MATQKQKDAAMKHLKERIQQAEDAGLHTVAMIWREYLANFAARPAEELVIAREFGSFEGKD